MKENENHPKDEYTMEDKFNYALLIAVSVLKWLGIAFIAITSSFAIGVIAGNNNSVKAALIFVILLVLWGVGIFVYLKFNKKKSITQRNCITTQYQSEITDISSSSISENNTVQSDTQTTSQYSPHTMSDIISNSDWYLQEQRELSNAKLQSFINNCNREDHIKPYAKSESCIAEFTDMDRRITELKEHKKSIAFYDDFGVLTDFYPFDENLPFNDQLSIPYKADYIVFSDRLFDTFSVDDINSIPTPLYKYTDTPVYNIEYHLRMHRGRTDNQALETAISLKAIELMKSNGGYVLNDYLTLISNLMKVGNFEVADRAYEDTVNYLRAKYKENNLNFDEILKNKKYNNENYQYLKQIFKKRWKQLQEYNLIIEHLPDEAPKSYTGYARMKTMNTKNYQSLVAKMKDKGFDIE